MPRRVWHQIEDWYLHQGVFYTLSALVHAAVLLVLVFALGNIITPKIHSVAPTFQSANVNTELPNSLESLDVDQMRLEPADLGATSLPAAGGGEASAENPDPNAEMLGEATGGASGDAVSAADAAVGFGGGGSSASSSGSGTAGGKGGVGGLSGFGGGGGRNVKLLTSIRGPVPGVGGAIRRSSAKYGGVRQAGGAGDVVAGVLRGIKGELERGDLLVVWLVDGSISVIPDRDIIAEKIEPFFQQIEKQGKDNFLLMNAVVAFGKTTVQLVKPTKFSDKIMAAIRKMPVDPSGVENTMTAIQSVVAEYGKTWKGGMFIVVWTDESGEDILRLEEVIRMCQKRRVIISIVGPSAVLGSSRGTHYYVDPPTQQGFRLPVTRGPDTALPERLWVPYWHDSVLPPWVGSGTSGAQIAAGLPWYGGPHREGLLSGIGPYALTRLAMETGGTFTLLDRKEDMGPFTLEDMRRYLPDYESAADYIRRVQASKLRTAVSTAVQRTYIKLNIQPPIMSFVTTRTDRYPYAIVNPYYTAPAFRAALFDELPRQEQLCREGSQMLEAALEPFGKDGLEDYYTQERSVRWKAWYDLTRGRLLAMSVRHLEYVLTCQQVRQAGILNADTNRMQFIPVAEYKAGSVIEERAKEAFRLLDRCRKENKNTPWALMAEWELAHPLGLKIKQIVVPPPAPGGPAVPQPPAPVIILPSL